MSKYTTEVRFICEESAGLTHSEGYSSIDSVLDKARDKVFDFYFPIFDENYRTTLENKILKHYYTREIGFETVGLWKHFLDVRMNEIMPYYNQLYSSELIKFNPLYDVDLTTDYNKINNGNSDKSSAYAEQSLFNENENTINQANSASSTVSNAESNTVEENNTASQENGTMNELISGETNKISNGKEVTNNSGIDNTISSSHGTDNNAITNKNDHWEYFSDTPESGIEGLTASGAIGDLNYLTTATHITDDGTGSSHNKTLDNNSSTEKSLTSESETNKTINETDNNTSANNRVTDIDKIANEINNKTETTDGTINKEENSTASINNDKTGTNEKSGNSNTNEIIKNIEDYLHHVVGKSGGVSYSKLLNEYRDTFLNIDMMIIKDLKDLFMNVW